MQVELSEKEIETISACLLAMILFMEQSDNDNENDKGKQFKNDVGKIYGRMLKLGAEKDQKNEN